MVIPSQNAAVVKVGNSQEDGMMKSPFATLISARFYVI
jgi:hypothetical protein